jgi:polar amino acid transport system permease protein
MDAGDIFATLVLGYPQPREMIDPRFPELLQRPGGLVLTLLVTVGSLAIGAVIGALLALYLRATTVRADLPPVERALRRGLRALAAAVMEVVRGIPIMLLVLLVFHLPYRLLEIRVPGVILAMAAFSLYAGVYLCEILRSGFRSVDPALLQAGQVLGLRRTQIFLRIELPIALRNMRPDLVNLAITVFKDTSTLAVVALAELSYTARLILISDPARYGLVLFLVLLCYWVPASALTAVARRAEQRTSALISHRL